MGISRVIGGLVKAAPKIVEEAKTLVPEARALVKSAEEAVGWTPTSDKPRVLVKNGVLLNRSANAAVRAEFAKLSKEQGVVYPKLGEAYEMLSRKLMEVAYNCIAHTLGVTNERVWPGASVRDFDALYASKGYRPVLDGAGAARLDAAALASDPTKQKVVLYGFQAGNPSFQLAEDVMKTANLPMTKGQWYATHAIIQEKDGAWTSKMGSGPLLRLPSPDSLNQGPTGDAIRVYERARP